MVGPVLAQGLPNSPGPGQDPVKLSFVIMGCNRIQPKDWDKIKADDPSSANLPQLKKTFQDISRMKPVPSYLFFMGDLVLNLEADEGETLEKQLVAWTALYKATPLAAMTTLIPLPGNHEMLKTVGDKDKAKKGGKDEGNKDGKDKHKKGGKDVGKKGGEDEGEAAEVPNPATVPRWLKWLRDSGFDTFARRGNGPTDAPPNRDKLSDDQSRMTYFFNIGDVHFIVINTDTLNTQKDGETNAPYSGWVPYHWIEQDVRKAQANPEIKTIFLVGHKPIMDHPAKEEDSILNTDEHPLGAKLQALFLANDKVRAYLCAHEHLWDCCRLKHAPPVWQVIAGNAGSKLNKKWITPAPFFGFTRINVYASGKVGLVSYQRPAPCPPTLYYEGTPDAAKAQPEIILYAPGK
jgi:hypothetical protein